MLILIFVISIDWSTWQLGRLYMHILMFHNIYNIACYDCLGFSISSTRAVWLIAHAATTSLMVDENVLRPTLGIILPDASPSVFPRAGRWSTFFFKKKLYSFFFVAEFQSLYLSKELEPATVAPMCWRWKDPNRLMKSQKELRHWSIRGIAFVPFSQSDKHPQGAHYKNHQLETSDGQDRGQEHGRRGRGWK